MLASMIIGAAAGAAIGSYLGCAAWRLPRRIPLWRGRSVCPGCGRDIPSWRNVPVLTFLLQRGRAACCGGPLARRYLLAEGLSGCIGAGTAIVAGSEPAALAVAAAAVVLVPAAISWITAER